MKGLNKRNIIWGSLSWIPLTFCLVNLVVNYIDLQKNCIGYLKRASNANTVVLAERELSTALKYLELQGLTQGYTSIFIKTPDEDIGFFYQNLVASKNELVSLINKPDLTSLEQSNALLKLRDTLTDHSNGQENVTHPSGLHMFPFNTKYFVFSLLAAILGVITTFLFLNSND